MVSDSELAEYLGQVLRTADLTTTTNAILRKQLEEHFGVDLSGKKAFIREQVDLYFQNLDNNAGEDADAAEEDEEAGKETDAQNGNDSDGGGKAEEGDEGEEEEEGDDDDEEDDSGAGSSNGKNRKKKVSNKSGKDVKRKGGGFTKLCSLSPQLQSFVGESELARTEVVKRIWAHIREHDLQDPSNRRKIICDAKLNAIFNVKSIDMFQMNKVLAKHIWPLNSSDVSSTVTKEKEKEGKRPKKLKEEEEDEDEEEDEPSKKEKRRKTGTTAFLAPLPISDALSKFVGNGATEMTRADVVKNIWKYIKENKLQDPSDKRRIICDAKLKELFDVDSFHGFTVAKFLGPHFIKSEK